MQLWLPAGSTARAATARAALLAAGTPACMGLCGLRASEHSAIQLSPQQPPLQDMTKFIKKHAKVPFELPKKKKKGEAGGHSTGCLCWPCIAWARSSTSRRTAPSVCAHM